MADTEYDSFVKSLRGGNEDAEYKSFVASLGSFRAPPAPPPVAAIPETPSAWRRVPDIGVMGLKGAVGLAETGIGLADIPTMGAVGRGLEKIGVRPREAQEELSTWYSPQQRQAQAEVSGAFKEGFVPGVVSALRRPSTTATTVGESLPSMLAGGVGARALVKAKNVAPWLAGAISEGGVGAGSAAEQIRQQSETGYLSPKQLLSVVGSGAGTAALGALGGRLSERFGVGDIETAMARGSLREGAEAVPAKIPKSFWKRAAISGVTEGVFEELPQSVQEQMWQNYALDKPLTEGLAEAAGMGALAGAGMGATVGALSRPRDLIKKATPIEEVIQPTRDVRGMVPDIFTGEMRPPVDEYQAAMDDAIRQVSPGQSEMFAPRPMATTSGQPIAFGVTTGAGGTRVVRGGKAAKETAIPKAGKLSPIEEARARVDALFPKNTPEHIDATNILDTVTSKTRGKALAAVNKMISSAQKGEPYAGQIEKPSKGVLRTEGAQPQIEVGLPGVREGDAQSQEVAGEGEAQKALDVFGASLPKQQGAVFNLLRSDPDKYTNGDGSWNVTAMAQDAGFKAKGNVTSAVKQLRKKLDAAAGQDVKAALAATATAKRVTEPSAYEQLGLSPAKQASVVAPEEVLGGEGLTQSMGEISSVGGSQGATSADVSGPMTQQDRAVEHEAQAIVREGGKPAQDTTVPQPTERGLEAVREQKVSDIVEAIRSGDAQDAVFEWNQLVGRVGGLEEIPTNLAEIELTAENIDALHAVVSAFQDVQQQVEASIDSGKFFDEIGAYEYEFKRIVRERQARIEKVVSGGRKEARTAIAEKPEAGGVAAEAGRKPAESVGKTGLTAAEDDRYFQLDEKDSKTAAEQKEYTDLKSRRESAPWTFPIQEPAKKAGVKVEVKKRRTIMRSEGATQKPSGNTVAVIVSNLRELFFSPVKMDSVVSVVQTEEDLPETADMDEIRSANGAVQGFYDKASGKAWLIANNIPVGQELSVMLHEVGVHMGMRNMLGPENYTKLTNQLKEWYHTGTGREKKLVDLAVGRVMDAQKSRVAEGLAEMSDEAATEEMLAYFVEEAVNDGVNPTALGGLSEGFQKWIKSLWLAVMRAVRKIGIDPNKLTAEDVVDLAYGAANMELRKGGTPEGAVTTEAKTSKYKSEQLFEKAEQFIKKTGDYHTIRVEKQESGEVWATRIPAKRAEKMFSMAATAGMSVPEAVAWNEGTVKKAIKDQARHALNVGLDKVMFTEDLIERAVRRGLTTAKEFGRLMAEKMATRDSIEQGVANIMSRALDLPQAEKAAASEFIRKSTTEQKWGYAPEWSKSAEVDPAMRTAFGKLSPMAQAVVKDVFKFGEETHTRLQAAVNQDINNEFDELLKIAETPEAKADIESRRAAKIAQVGKIMPKLDGPYAPLKRFGNHIMVAMSKEFADAKKNDDKAAMEKMQSDERHLLVEHLDTRAEAIARTDQLRPLYKDGSVETWVKQESFKHVSELPWAGIAKVKAAIEGLPEGSKHKHSLQNMLTDLYLSMMSETSARKSELARKNISGANKDMFRAFASQGSATAHFITSLENSGDVSRAITQMQTDAREGEAGTRSDRTAVLNELSSRFAQSLEYSQTPMVNRALKATSFWMLMTSPAFYVQNSLQPFMITVPYLAGRFGASRSWKEMTRAYKDIAKYTISAKSHQLDVTTLPNVTANEKEMLKEMQKYGKLDLTIMQDIGRYTEGKSVLDKGLFGTVMRKLWAGPQRVELLNRVASALAAYRLATGTEEQKLAYTGDVISKTHGNYSSFNAPRFFTSSGAMRLITQFRKFQLIQLTLLTKLTHEAFKGASVEERAVARRSLYWLLGQHAVMTGALGLPIPAVMWAVAASLGSGDDEPEDYEQWLRNLVGDEDAADLLLRGVPAYFGLSMSQKIGMGTTFSALPFADIPKDRAGYEKFLTASLGASAGLGGQWFDALGKMGKGDYYKGVETALPSGLKNMMKGYRIATEGVTSNAGDTLMAPEDVSLVDAFAQGAGLPTMTISERQRKQGVVIEATKFYNERSSDLKRDYIKAYKAKDTEAMSEVRESWKQLQSSRAAVGFKRQPLGDLIKTPMAQKKRERAAARGVEYTTQTKGFVERLT